MANIYDMNAAIDKPNILGAVQQGMQFGQQQRKLREDRADQQQLRNLAPAIMGGDPNAYEQAAVIDTKAAQGYQDAGDSQYRRLKGAVDYVNQARATAKKTGDMRYVNAALQQVGPYFSKLINKPIPPTWTPDMDEGWAQLEARVAMADQGGGAGKGVLSTYIDDQGRRVAVNRDGTTSVLGGADQGMAQQTITVNGPDGRPAQYTFNKRTGGYEPAALGAPTATATQPTQSQGAPQGGQLSPSRDFAALSQEFGIQPSSLRRTPERNAAVGGVPNSYHLTGEAADYPVPPQMKAQFMARAQAMGYQAIDEGDHVHLEPPRRGETIAPSQSPFVGRTPEEEAAAVARAKAGVELETLPESERIKRDSAVQQAAGIEAAKTAAERAAAAPATIATLQNSLDSIDELLSNPELESVVGIGSLNPLNKIPGTNARGLIARADQIAGQAFLAAFNQLKGGGAITEREGQAATQAMARLDRSQSLADYKGALTDLRNAISPAIARAQQQAAGGRVGAPGASVQRARNPQTGEVLVLRNGQWVPE